MKPSQHIEVCFSTQSDQARVDYRTRLTASVDCIRFLLRQGLAFRGHDESEDSINQGNFLELLHFVADHNEDIKKVVFKNAPENLKMIAPKIQKDIVNAMAVETTNAILRDVGDELFSILVDESRDISVKEQMTVILRYVDKKGYIIERFIGIVHVHDTTSLSLKASIESLFAKHGLSMSSLRGQGYDGASNMQGEFNGLKSLIMLENKSIFYVHCFAHQLQLTLVAIAKKHKKIGSFFNLVTSLSNTVGASCKRKDILRERQFENVIKGICSGEIITGRGLNQEATLKRAGDTRWSSHYTTILSVILLFSSVIDVLEVVENDGTLSEQRAEASDLLDAIQSFEFAFQLHLMKTVLGISNELSQALQKKDQDIVNAMSLVKVSKERLQKLRDNG